MFLNNPQKKQFKTKKKQSFFKKMKNTICSIQRNYKMYI